MHHAHMHHSSLGGDLITDVEDKYGYGSDVIIITTVINNLRITTMFRIRQACRDLQCARLQGQSIAQRCINTGPATTTESISFVLPIKIN